MLGVWIQPRLMSGSSKGKVDVLNFAAARVPLL